MTETPYNHKWMNLEEDSNGEAFIKMGNDAVMIFPLTSADEILFIEEKSIAYQRPVLTLPTGAVEKGELRTVSANRELQEEVGYVAGALEHVGTLNPTIKYMRWKCDVYLARNLVQN